VSRQDLPRWSLAVALLLAPAGLRAQAAAVSCGDGTTAASAKDCASHGGVDSAATATARKAPSGAATATVVCVDGATGHGVPYCASHGGVDSINTEAARRARGEPVDPNKPTKP